MRSAKRKYKLQSAMEYLMTYGWAILIIAIVLAALFGLGVFGGNSPRQKAGACQVYRPYGPGTAVGASLAGQCNNEIPQYVVQFNGQSSYVDIPNSNLIDSINTLTISAWVATTSTNVQIIFSTWDGTNGAQIFVISPNGVAALWSNGGNNLNSQATVNGGKWHNIVGVWTGPGAYLYVDGAQVANGIRTVSPSAKDNQIGTQCVGAGGTACNDWFNGLISNVQFYNTSLSQAEVTALYDEGIGGAPVKPQNLVGWWPLNGNANDYSGNSDNGQPTGIAYTSSWTSGYSIH